MKNEVEEHVCTCSVVATTSTLASLPTGPISGIRWPSVMVDEVTMVTPAMCTFLASIASDRLLLAGDPRQLGPVYEEPRKALQEDPCLAWMGRDVFDISGVSKGEGEARRIATTDPRLVRITSQRRCATEIWERVCRLYPEVNHLANEAALAGIRALPPCPGHAVAILDTSGCDAVAVKKQHSWQNEFAAQLALEVASTVAAEANRVASVAIIAPYRAQVQMLRRWLRQEHTAENGPVGHYRVECGTVHQFQGSDADVVIFGLVDGPGR